MHSKWTVPERCGCRTVRECCSRLSCVAQITTCAHFKCMCCRHITTHGRRFGVQPNFGTVVVHAVVIMCYIHMLFGNPQQGFQRVSVSGPCPANFAAWHAPWYTGICDTACGCSKRVDRWCTQCFCGCGFCSTQLMWFQTCYLTSFSYDAGRVVAQSAASVQQHSACCLVSTDTLCMHGWPGLTADAAVRSTLLLVCWFVLATVLCCVHLRHHHRHVTS
jgi:hypothetical protein